jgi:uncharacterized surface protein with fasciclin (FAS1) repeats
MKTLKPFHLLSLILALGFAFAALAPSAAYAKSEQPEKPGMTIVETAASVNQKTGEFSTLIAALKAAGLLNKFDGSNHFTVFAPTDAAFARLGLNAENIGSLPSGKLADILAYHVLRGSRYANGVVAAKELRMLNGDKAPVTVTNDGAFIDGAKIVTTNIPTENGVIHVIDTVMLPPQ